MLGTSSEPPRGFDVDAEPAACPTSASSSPDGFGEEAFRFAGRGLLTGIAAPTVCVCYVNAEEAASIVFALCTDGG